MISNASSSRRRWSTPSGPCCGYPRVSTSWRLRLSPWAIQSAPTACASCSQRSVSRGRSTGTPTKDRTTLIAMKDTKKKELVGNYRNAGSDWRPKGAPQHVKVHDFEDKKLGKVAPYGVYDIAADAGWVSVGITCDTAEFAVASIRTWLERIGRARYPKARELTITADCGGSNGSRVRLWKVELQKLADETGLTIKVRHYPPGTSKWNKIEHRLFCRITQNWRGHPLTDHATIIDLMAATTTNTGLKVEAVLDTTVYEKGIKVRDAEMKRLNICGDAFHPEWNYAVVPRPC